jgi:hypothetical protein
MFGFNTTQIQSIFPLEFIPNFKKKKKKKKEELKKRITPTLVSSVQGVIIAFPLFK